MKRPSLKCHENVNRLSLKYSSVPLEKIHKQLNEDAVNPLKIRPILRVLLATCALFGISAASGAAEKSELTIAVAEVPSTLEPALELSNVGTRITYNVFDTLIRRDFLADGSGTASKLVPHLAESWKRLPDNGLELTLRKGVKFHNGDELTSEDVVFTFQRLLSPETPLKEAKGYFSNFERIEAPDRYTVRIFTKDLDVILEQRIASWASWIVNKRAYEEMGFEKFARTPVGTGPYKVKSLTPGESVVLEAHNDYFLGKPSVKRITFAQVPEQTARISGLVSGQYEMIVNIAPDQIDILKGYNDIDVRSAVLANSHVLVFNENHPVLADKRIRQALSYAIDRQALVKSLWNNEAVIPLGYQYPEYGDLYDSSRKGFVFDLEKAKKLVMESGYKGETITFHTQANYYLNGLQAAQIMQEMWKAAGLNVSLQVIENFKQVPDKDIMIRNWSNSSRYPDPAGSLVTNWGGSGNPQRAWKTFAAPGADLFNAQAAVLEKAIAASDRKAALSKLIDIWEDDVPGTILYQPLETYGVSTKIKWKPYSFYYMDLRPYNLQIQ